MRSTLRFYAELNDFLPPARRQAAFERSLMGPTAVKDLIEGVGVPHTEVDLVLVNGQSVDFSYRVKDGDHVSVYPVFESVDIASITRVRPDPLRELRFVLDGHLGRLAAYLRLAGFDASYQHDLDDHELAELASAHGRVLLTRDQALLKRRAITRGYWVRATQPRQQLREVIDRFDLKDRLEPFRRCLRCNATLAAVPKAEVLDALPPRTRANYDEFYRCAGCGRVYWKGAHFSALTHIVASILPGRR